MAKYVKTEQGYKEIEAINSNKMDKNNPVGTGSFSMGRKYGSLIGLDSHAEGNNTTASGPYSHAEGHITTASGSGSHAEGYRTTASGVDSHAEGYNTTASGEYSHAEGSYTIASGFDSHAEGYNTTASGSYSHVEGANTTASGSHQHVQGKYNVVDSQHKYAHIVGNGTNNSARSNAHTLDWNGVPWFKGRPQFGSTAQDQGSQTVMANGDKEIILASSTANSTKKFKITVDDDYNVSATNTSDSVSKTLATTEYVDSSVSKSNPLNITGASVGKIAKISAVDEDGKPTAWEAVDMQNGAQPDWNQNDETAADYVKNRTHYEEVLNEYVIFEGTLPNFDTTKDLPLQYAITSDTSVTAYYNGSVVATVVGYYPGGGAAAGTLYYGFSPDLGLTVDNITMKASVYNGMGDGVLKFAVADFTVVHPLDKKYIPDDIARVEDIPVSLPNPHKLTFSGAVIAEYDGSEAVEVAIPSGGGGADLSLGVEGAAVGQIAKITAVDSNGKPNAWQAVDMPSGGGSGGVSEEVWRLVRTITTTEEVASVEISTDEDGQIFSLKKIWCRLAIKGSDTNSANGNLRVNLNANPADTRARIVDVADFVQSVSGRTRNLEIQAEPCTTEARLYGFYLPIGSVGKGDSSQVYSLRDAFEYFESYQTVASMCVYSKTGEVFGAGTTIELWGVDA